MTGGYKMVNLSRVNLSASPVTIKGIHELVESNYHKAIIIGGLVINNVEWAARPVSFTYADSAYVGIIGCSADYKLTLIKITDTDEVSITTEE